MIKDLTHEDVKKERSRHMTEAGRYIADVIYGANDGIITTFAIVAASSAVNLSPGIIIILGFANLVADGFSMAASNYLGIKSRRDFEERQKQIEEYEIEKWPEEEKKELEDIYREKGFQGEDLRRAVEIVSARKDIWVKEMLISELNIIPENGQSAPAWKHALATFISFVLIGSVSLFPFFFKNLAPKGFLFSIIFALVTFFFIGGLRSRITQKGFFISGLQMLLVGSLAGGTAYLIGFLVRQLFGISI